MQNNIFWKFVCVWLYFCCSTQLVLQMFSCWHRTDIIFCTVHKQEFLLADSVITSAANFPDFWNDLEGSPEKNSLRSDTLYASFNKSLVFRSVISNWYLIRLLLFTLQGFSKNQLVTGMRVKNCWCLMTVHFEATGYLKKFSYSHANFFPPEVSKMLLQEVKWTTFYPYNVPHNQFYLHFKNCHIWKHTRQLSFNLKLHIKLIHQGYCTYLSHKMKKPFHIWQFSYWFAPFVNERSKGFKLKQYS